DSLYGRFSYADFDTFQPFGSSNLNETLVPGFGTGIHTKTRNGVINHTHLFSPNFVHDLRFGFLSADGGQRLQNQGANFASLAGLAGVTSGPGKMGFPAISFAGQYDAMGDPSTVVSRNNFSTDLFSTFSWIKGSHTVK